MKALLLLLFTFLFVKSLVKARSGGNDLQRELFSDVYNKQILSGPTLLNKRFPKHPAPKPKRHEVPTDYTVFPQQHISNKPVDVPGSAYFPRDVHHDEPKLRVKKVLPDFWQIHDRKKRSAPETTKKSAAKPKTDDKKSASKPKADNKKPASKPKTDDKKTTSKPKTDVKKTASKLRTDDKKPVSKPKTDDKKPAIKPKTDSKKTTSKLAKKPKRKSNADKSNRKSKRKSRRSASKSGKRKSKRSASRRNLKSNADIDGRRLIAGRDATIEDYPYVVSIQKDGEHWCAGSLLNQRLVITTANCVWKSSRMSRMKIRTGSRHLSHGGQVLSIVEVVKHPEWSIRKNPDNDVALLLTDGFVKFSHSCHGVDLPNRVMMPMFEDAWVTSWGAERRDGVYVPQGLTLQVYHTQLMNREKCNNITMRFGVIVTENFICLEQLGRRAPCTRDTGAPAVSDGVLWGMASWGIRKLCGTERFPAMFSYIASHSNMDFIINATKYLMSDERQTPFLDRYVHSRTVNDTPTPPEP